MWVLNRNLLLSIIFEFIDYFFYLWMKTFCFTFPPPSPLSIKSVVKSTENDLLLRKYFQAVVTIPSAPTKSSAGYYDVSCCASFFINVRNRFSYSAFLCAKIFSKPCAFAFTAGIGSSFCKTSFWLSSDYAKNRKAFETCTTGWILRWLDRSNFTTAFFNKLFCFKWAVAICLQFFRFMQRAICILN